MHYMSTQNKDMREKTHIYILNKTILVCRFRWTQHWLIMNNTNIPIGRNINWSKTKLTDQRPFNMEQAWNDYTLITNLVHWLSFIHKILFFSTRFEAQVLIFRRIQLYTCSIWYCHSLWEFQVACRYTAWVRTDCRRKVVGGYLTTPTNNLLNK